MPDKSLKGKIISISEAIKLASDEGIKISDQSIRYWCRNHKELGIGKKAMGRWGIDRDNFLKFLKGDIL